MYLYFSKQVHTRICTLIKHVFILLFTIQVSKFGNVGIYDEKFRLQRQYEIDIDTDPNEDFDVAASDPGQVKQIFYLAMFCLCQKHIP